MASLSLSLHICEMRIITSILQEDIFNVVNIVPGAEVSTQIMAIL